MDKALFAELVTSLKEAKAIRAGKKPASRRFKLTVPHVRDVREKTGLTQLEFAQVMQVSVKTLQNWEQDRRAPTGPAAALIKIVSVAPKVALKALHA
jgi:putative transcriptional regulator